MKKVNFGSTGKQVPAIVMGCMRMKELTVKEAAKLVDAAMALPTGDGTTEVQVVSWYDNENSYTSQMVRTIKYFGKLLEA